MSGNRGLSRGSSRRPRSFGSAKGPKTRDAPSGRIGWDGRELPKSGPTRSSDKARIPGAGRQASKSQEGGTFKQCQSLAARLGLATGEATVAVSVRCGRESGLVRSLSSQAKRMQEGSAPREEGFLRGKKCFGYPAGRQSIQHISVPGWSSET